MTSTYFCQLFILGLLRFATYPLTAETSQLFPDLGSSPCGVYKLILLISRRRIIHLEESRRPRVCIYSLDASFLLNSSHYAHATFRNTVALARPSLRLPAAVRCCTSIDIDETNISSFPRQRYCVALVYGVSGIVLDSTIVPIDPSPLLHSSRVISWETPGGRRAPIGLLWHTTSVKNRVLDAAEFRLWKPHGC